MLPNMLTQILADGGLADPSQWHWQTVALVLFLLSFAAILFYATTRSPRQVEHWSALPLESGEEIANQPAAIPLTEKPEDLK